MLKGRLKEEVNAQSEMSGFGPRGTSRLWHCSGQECVGPANKLPAWVSVGHKLAWLIVASLQLPLCSPEVVTDDIIKWFFFFGQKQSALLSHKLVPPAHPKPITGVSQAQSSSPSHSPGHSLPCSPTQPRFGSCEGPSILGAARVLLTPLSYATCCARNKLGSVPANCD